MKELSLKIPQDFKIDIDLRCFFTEIHFTDGKTEAREVLSFPPGQQNTWEAYCNNLNFYTSCAQRHPPPLPFIGQ